MKRLAHLRFGALSLINWPVVRLMSLVSAKLVRRDPAKFAFIGMGGDFRDNSAYAVLDGAADLGDCVWLANSPDECEQLERLGVPALTRKSRAGVLALMRAGTVVVCDNSYWLSWFGQGSRAVNLWHGIPTKRIGYDLHGELGYRFPSPDRRDVLARSIRSGRLSPTALLSVSPLLTPHFMSAFSVEREQCLEFGYPRCDHLLNPDGDSPAAAALRDFHGIHIEQRSDVCRIGYFPTWRDSGSTQRVAETLQHLVDADLGVEIELIYKPHHLMADLELPTSSGSASIRVLPAHCDLNSILGFVDVLVSDYSSVCWDFLLLDRPTVFVETDRDVYADERGFYPDVAALVYGDVVEDLAELDAALIDAIHDPDRHRERRAESREAAWGPDRGGSTARLVAWMLDESD